jgi:hypothetical protein
LEIRILRRLHSGPGRGRRNYDETEKPIPNANVSRFFGKNNKKWGKKGQKLGKFVSLQSETFFEISVVPLKRLVW